MCITLVYSGPLTLLSFISLMYFNTRSSHFTEGLPLTIHHFLLLHILPVILLSPIPSEPSSYLKVQHLVTLTAPKFIPSTLIDMLNSYKHFSYSQYPFQSHHWHLSDTDLYCLDPRNLTLNSSSYFHMLMLVTFFLQTVQLLYSTTIKTYL